MAYAIKYLFKFESSNGTTREIRVLKDGYSGDVIQRPLGRAPMLKKQQNGPVHGTSLEFYAECNVDREFIEFYTSNPKDYRVDLYAGATLLWQGYITPELYSEPDIAPPYDVQVVATDGVGELKLYDYAVQGTVTLRNLLAGLLTRTGLGTDIYLISSLKPGSAGAGSLLEKSINLDYMAGKTCYDVLTYILDTLHATITWWKGAWILTRETNVTFTNGKVRYFNTAGNSALLNDSVQVLGVMRTNPAWPVGQLSTVIDPAKNKVAVQAPWHPVTCLQNADMASDTAWAKYNSAAYNTGAGGYYFPYPLSGTPQLRQQVSMAGIRVPLTLSVRATAATAAAGQGAPTQIGAALIYTVGGISYHLRKGTDGGLVWEAGPDVPSAAIPPRGAPVDFSQALAMWDAGRIEAEELKIENIPAFMQNGTFPAGTLTVYILGYCATVYGVYLDVVLPKGYQDILCLDNGARGEGSTVEIAIGRETTDNAYYAAFLQGLLLDSGSLITSFSDANFTTGMDYLAFIARDYALSVALPRAKVTGTVFLESSVQFPPLVFSKGVLDYWLETWGWNLYEDELEIEARTLPSASLSIQSETILESDGSTVSSSSGSGGGSSSSMGGGGVNYFEINEDLQTLIQPKNAYDYLSARDGLFFTGGDTTPTPDLYVDTVNNQRVLRSPLPLITGGDQIVIDGTPGGGGGGGGATTLAGLDDTNITNPTETQVLQYLGGKWKNVPSSAVGVTTPATSSANGLMSAEDYNKLEGIAEGATAVTESTVAGWGFTKNTGTVTSVKVGSTTYNPTSGVVSLPAYAFGTAGSDYVPVTIGNTTKNVLTAHQTVTLASGTNNGTLKLTTAAGTVDNIAVKGLGSMAYKSSLSASDIPTIAISKISGLQDALDAKADASSLASYVLKSGDTMTGNLTMDGSAVLVKDNVFASTTGWSRRLVEMRVDGSLKFSIGAYGNYTPNASDNGIDYAYIGTNAYNGNNLRVYSDKVTFGGDTIYHEGNLTKAVLTRLLESESGYYVKKAGDTMTGDLTIQKSGGGTLYLRNNASNSAGGNIIFRSRTNDVNGVRIAGVRSTSPYTYDRLDLVFYVSNIEDQTYSWEEAMRIAKTKAVSINSSLSIGTTLGVEGLATLTGGATIPGTTTAYLQIGQAKITWDSNGYLYIDKPLVTAGDQIVISGTPSGGGGGGATTLKGLDDTTIPDNFTTVGPVLFYNGSKWVPSTISGLAANDLLQWNGTTWANVAASSVGRIYSAGTGISISNTNAISLSATYAGGTAVTLNGQSKAASTASFYAPATAGTTGQILKATTNGAPVWTSSALGDSSKPIYLNASGVLTEGVSCLPLTGGYIQSASGNKRLRITTDSSANYIQSWSSDSASANLNISGYNGNAGSNLYLKFDNIYAWDGSANKVVYHAGNFVAGTNYQAPMSQGTGITISNNQISVNSTYQGYITHGESAYNSLGNYVLKAGDTITGSITFNETSFDNTVPFVRNITNTGGWSRGVVDFKIGGSTVFRIGASGSGSSLNYGYIYTAGNDALRFYADGSLTYGTNTIWHSGNSNSTSVAWSASSLTLAGAIAGATTGAFSSNVTIGGTLSVTGTSTYSGVLNITGSTSYSNGIRIHDFEGISSIWFRAVNASGYDAGMWGVTAGDNGLRFRGPASTDATSVNDYMNILHGGNVGIGTSSPSYKLHVNGAAAVSTLTISSTSAESHLAFSRGGANYITAPASGTINFVPNGIAVSAANSRLSVADDVVAITKASGDAMLAIQGTSANVAAGTIWFRARSSSYNGIKIVGNKGSTSNSYDRISLDFMAASGTSSSSVTWKRALRITYAGNIYVGTEEATSTYTQYGDMTVNGSITSTGDQVVSSDLTKKKNLVPINLGIEQIAKAPAVTFDWKTGGHSFGSIAQYWKDVLGEAVLGEEGNYALAYGQLALVNTIIEAREIDKLKARVAELEAEVKQLRMN